ncbi:hypothetical protein [Exiguobacterium sp.]|uniref:hypothetical protein n=1 Tax=Exiguobacterium sp. TaxID=44751 RepID=UPI00289A3C27|nr:hypothetical protein [Exiguobacterium sp.]
MEEKVFEKFGPYILSSDVEEVTRLLVREVSEEDYRLALDLIQVLRLRIDRLEKKMKEELA